MTTGLANRRPAQPPNSLMIGGQLVMLDHAGGALLNESNTLVVADLHLEKAADFARTGQMLPPYDSEATLRALEVLVLRAKPTSLVLLGDSFHRSTSRLSGADAVILSAIAQRCALVWVTGNHDAELPADLPGERLSDLRIGGLVLRHEPGDDGAPEMIGHLHPSARIATRGGLKRRRCFLASTHRLLLPAFGALTGSLDIFDPPIVSLFPPAQSCAYLLAKDCVHRVPMRGLTPRRSAFTLSGR
ncbi:COG1407 Predicted ICC-like phosphoesterases [Rhabdaerophilaceae bacterium]